MAYPVTANSVVQLATQLDSKILAMYHKVLEISDDVAADNYNSLIRLPQFNEDLQSFMQFVISLGNAAKVLEQLSIMRDTTIVAADVTSFSNKVAALAADIESNSALFLMSFTLNKQPQFVTPVSAGVKNVITNRLNEILATVI